MHYRNMQELMEKAVRAEDGQERCFWFPKNQETIKVSELNPHGYTVTYAYSSGVIAFVDKNGDYYVIPASPDVTKTLEKNGYSRGELRVLYGEGDLPVDGEVQKKWTALWKELHND